MPEKTLPDSMKTTHRLPTDAELVSRALRSELEARLADLAAREAEIEKERVRLETLLAHHPEAPAADGLEWTEHGEAGFLVKL